MSDQVVISVDHLRKDFGQVRALDSVSFKVRKGEVFGFLGHNGAGKTTTVRILNGLLQPTEGTCRVWNLSPRSDGPDLRLRTGVLPESPSLDERLTARENLLYFADLYRVPEQEVSSRIDELLTQFGLIDRAEDAVGEYSKGMKQRLSLARAILHRPPLLFFDEPTAGLDPVSSRQVQDMIYSLSEEGRTVFLCTHNLQEAQRLCHRVAVLRHGQLIAQGTPDDLSARTQRTLRIDLEIERGGQEQVNSYLSTHGIDYQVEHDGTLYHMQGMNRESIPGMIRTLSQKGVQIYRVDPIQPTLEDVYFALHQSGEDV